MGPGQQGTSHLLPAGAMAQVLEAEAIASLSGKQSASQSRRQEVWRRKVFDKTTKGCGGVEEVVYSTVWRRMRSLIRLEEKEEEECI